MKELSVLENKIVQKEYEIINTEFKRAMDIINKTDNGNGKRKTEARKIHGN